MKQDITEVNEDIDELSKSVAQNTQDIATKADKDHTHTSFGALTMNGNLTFSDSGTNTREIRFTGGVDDCGRIAVGANAKNTGWMEIATADDVSEPIYVRQYKWVNGNYFGSIGREAALLDVSGNTSFPGNVTAKNITTLQNTVDTRTTQIAGKSDKGHTHLIKEITDYKAYDDTEVRNLISNKVDKTKITTYYRTFTRSQRWGGNSTYAYDIIGYIKPVNRSYTQITGNIQVTVSSTSSNYERFDVSIIYVAGGNASKNFTLSGNSFVSNTNGQSAILLNPVDDDKTAYALAIAIGGYTNCDSFGYQVVAQMPEMLKIYSESACTNEQTTNVYDTRQNNYSFGTIKKDSLTYSNIYWNEETRALKSHTHTLSEITDYTAYDDTEVKSSIASNASKITALENRIASKTETSYKYTISDLGNDFSVHKWGKEYDDGTYANYLIINSSIDLELLQMTTEIPVVELRFNKTKVLHKFTPIAILDFSEAFIYNGSQIYTTPINIDLSEFVWRNEALEDGEYSIYAYQDNDCYKIIDVSITKTPESNIKPSTDELVTFGTIRDLIYPVGTIYMSTNNQNPGTFIGGTWTTKSGIVSSGYAWVRTA